MKPVYWADVAEYVAAGNLNRVSINEDFNAISLEVIYLGNESHGGNMRTATVILDCIDCCYFDLRKRNDHEPGSGIILEAYLQTESSMVDALRDHRLESTAGCLSLEHSSESVYHLEIIGEISLNVLCKNVSIMALHITET